MKKLDSGPPWRSSYEENNYGDFFYSLVRVYQPEKVVELGTKAGYSAYHIARGLKANGSGSLDCYDLWEKYEFKSVPKSVAEKNLKKFRDIITLEQRDVVGAHELYGKIDLVRSKTSAEGGSSADHALRAGRTSNGVDILHVDLNNDGGILEKVVPHWINKVRQFIIIEGGSSERDKIEWMIKYKKTSIAKWLESFSRRRGDIEYLTIEPFPSVTIIRKK